eukprot:CAMPEP_0177668516 /NCGR_PEP_ID=MMETSP0447-20121125/22822_1 /TAXON_ID=0 /ORGANISM="Stygamoeba regulata, Strain BSH-02190019" /LENGTH=127 /DNA_ID=CAMNT_0019175067 /DNA_START=49 /DNA_END=432 /DNA_ORIENTATION=+
MYGVGDLKCRVPVAQHEHSLVFVVFGIQRHGFVPDTFLNASVVGDVGQSNTGGHNDAAALHGLRALHVEGELEEAFWWLRDDFLHLTAIADRKLHFLGKLGEVVHQLVCMWVVLAAEVSHEQLWVVT